MSTPTTKEQPMGKQENPAPAARHFFPGLWISALRQQLTRGELGAWPVLFGLVIIWILFQSQNENFLTARNLSNLILQTGVLGTLALGVVLILLIGEIDLSIGAVSGVCAAIMGVLLTNQHWNAWGAMGAAILLGTAIGLLQGSLTVFVGVPSFIVTLAGLLAWQGVQLILLGDVGELRIQDSTVRQIASAYLAPEQSWIIAAVVILLYALTLWLGRVARSKTSLEQPPLWLSLLKIVGVAMVGIVIVALLNSYFGVPYLLLILLLLTVLFTLLTGRSIFGRHMYAIGGNSEAARRAGIRVGAVRIAVFALVSTLAALGGIIGASREFAVSTGSGGGTLQLDAIAAAVIGGTSLFGGRGKVYNALLGALVIVSVENGLDLLGQPSSTKNIATGIILFIAVAIDALSRRRRQAVGA